MWDRLSGDAPYFALFCGLRTGARAIFAALARSTTLINNTRNPPYIDERPRADIPIENRSRLRGKSSGSNLRISFAPRRRRRTLTCVSGGER